MPEYRFYCINEEGHFVRSIEFSAAGDGEAIARAKELRDGQAAELWSGSRIVAKFERVPAS